MKTKRKMEDIVKSVKAQIFVRRGVDNTIYSAELERTLNLTGVQVRDAVRLLRRQGYPIANSKKGYFWAETAEEMRETLDDLASRRNSLSMTLSAMMKNSKIPNIDQFQFSLNR